MSHFGDIDNSPLWLILNNPKGDRLDEAVGTSPACFGVSRRGVLSDAAIGFIKTHFDDYFKSGAQISEFFSSWIGLLDGILFNGEALTFSGGGICAVDLIKCPTSASWMDYVMTPEGKRVWDNCLRDDQGNRFLLRQMDLHRPRILVFAGTQNCVKGAWRGTADRQLSTLAKDPNSALIKGVWTLHFDQRVSIGLASQRVVDGLDSRAVSDARRCSQRVIDAWASRWQGPS